MTEITDAEIKTRCDALARSILGVLERGCDSLPFADALAIPFGVAAALAYGSKVSREHAVAMLNSAWDDIEGAQE